jgi:hypothetical protein
MRFAIAGAVALALACGGDGATGPSASSVTGVAGDSQVAPTGAALQFPLSFLVLGSSGQPLPGVSVRWSVTPAGRATFSPPTSTSNSLGEVTTNVTVGVTPGEVVIQATVPGVQPVIFHALVLNPCQYAASYTIGASVNGTLAASDCHQGGDYFTDFYEFTVAVQQGVTATMSATFDAWLDAYRGSGPQMAANNDAAPGTTNAQVQLIVAAGTYVLAPNSRLENISGAYTLTSAVRPQTLSGCSQVWGTANITITDNIATTDCRDSTAAGISYADLIGIIAFPNDTIRLTERSAAMDPRLTLYRVDDALGFVFVASNDGSAATTTDAFIQFAVTVRGVYVVEIGSADSAGTGAYTLSIGGSASLGPTPFPTAAWSGGRAGIGRAVWPTRLPRKR